MAQRYTGELFKGCYDAAVRTTASVVVSRSAVPPKVASRKIKFARTLEPTVMEYFRSGNGREAVRRPVSGPLDTR